MDQPQPSSRLGIGVTLFILGFGLAWCLLEARKPPPYWPPPSASAPVTSAAAEAPLPAFNKEFRARYRQAKEEALAHSGPVILLLGDDVTLFRDGQKVETKTINPPGYDQLKVVAHMPLTIYVALAPSQRAGSVSDRTTPLAYAPGALQRLRAKIVAAQAAFPSQSFTPAQLARSEKIATGCLQFIGRVENGKGSIACEHLTEFARDLAPLALDHGADAARVELDALHQACLAWRKTLTPAEWRQLRAVVAGSAMPRQGNRFVQYFAKLLGEPGEGLRIIYAEQRFTETLALDLLAASLVDTGIGQAFFNDRLRMHRDLLDEAARAYLDKLTFEGGR